MASKTEGAHIDVQQRLVQWKLEATDRQHANYGHADLDEQVGMHSTLSDLLDRLRSTPECEWRL